MNKAIAMVAVPVIAAIIIFSTVQLYRGNLGAAFSAAPFLLVLYVFLQTRR